MLQRITVILGTSLLALSCSTLRTEIHYDPATQFESIETYAWVAPRDDVNPAEEIVPGFGERLRTQIETALALDGLRRVEDGESADVQVAYYTALRENTWVSTWNYRYSPFWNGRPGYVSPWGYGFGGWYRQPLPRVHSRTVGTLVVDMIDPNDNELVWRGWARGVVNPDDPDDELFDAASEVLAKFPPENSES